MKIELLLNCPYFMDLEARRLMIEDIVEFARHGAPSEVRDAQALLSEATRLPGFQETGASTEEPVVRVLKQFETLPVDMAERVFSYWVMVQHRLYTDVVTFLRETEENTIDILCDTLNAGLESPELEDLVDVFADEHREYDAFAARLMFAYSLLTHCEEGGAAEALDDADLTHTEEPVHPLWVNFLTTVRALPPEDPAWNDFPVFMERIQDILDDRIQIYDDEKRDEIDKLLAELESKVGDHAAALGIEGIYDWNADDVAGEDLDDAAAGIEALLDAVFEYISIASGAIEDTGGTGKRARKGQAERDLRRLAREIREIYDDLDTLFVPPPEEQ